MIINILGCFFLIGMSFYIRHVANPSITTNVITWSMFFVGLFILGIPNKILRGVKKMKDTNIRLIMLLGYLAFLIITISVPTLAFTFYGVILGHIALWFIEIIEKRNHNHGK